MQYELESQEISSIRRRFTFTVPRTVVKAELDVEYGQMKGKVQMRGFRPGKVPLKVLAARFGPRVRADVAERIVNQIWREAAGDIDVAGQPKLADQADLNPKKPFVFNIEVDVKPAVELGEYTSLEVEYTRPEVDEADVQRMADVKLASQRRIAEVTDDRAVEDGDFVLTSLQLMDGEEEVIEEPGTLVNTAAERFYPGIESLLIGLKKGERKTGEVTISDKSVLDQIKGNTYTATVGVEAIQTYVTPELTDEVASELGYEGGVEGMQAALRMELDQRIDDQSRQSAQVKLLQALVNSHEFDVPPAMIDEQFEALVEEHKIRRAYAGEDMRTITIDEATNNDLRSRARFAAKASVLLLQIGRVEGLDATTADLDAKIAEIATQRGQTPQAIRGYLEKEAAMPVLRTRVLEEKVLEWLMENADLKPVAPAAVEPEEVAAAAPEAEAAGEE